MATYLTSFGAFVGSTGPAELTGPEHVWNDASRQNYGELTYFWAGQQMSSVLQGGQYIQDRIFLNSSGGARMIDFGETSDASVIEPGANISNHWRTMETNIAWERRVISLQAGGKMTSGARFQVFKNLRNQYWQNMYTNWHGFLQDQFWAIPNKTTMEGASGKDIMSIPAYINESANGLAVAGTANGGTWTQVQGLLPTDAGQSNWQNQRFTYDNLTVNSSTNLINAFDRAIELLKFTPPPTNKEYFESPAAKPMDWIACSLTGKTKLRQLYRASNDRWDSWDAFLNPTYDGISVVYCGKLDTATIFPLSATTMGSETTATVTGPRFFLINSRALTFVVHDEWFMLATEERSPFNQPTKSAIFFHTMCNMFCKSRRNLGIIYPTTSIPA